MRSVSTSPQAEADIDGITEYTKTTWGWQQADVYLAQLEGAFDHLAEHPFIGRSCDSIHLGLRRFEVGKHVVFYMSQPDGILIVRILHQQMVPTKPHFQP